MPLKKIKYGRRARGTPRAVCARRSGYEAEATLRGFCLRRALPRVQIGHFLFEGAEGDVIAFS